MSPEHRGSVGSMVADWLLVGAVASILVATLPPGPEPLPTEATRCVICGSRATADVIVNVVLFIPLGVALALRGLSARKILLVGLTLSAAVEAAQWFIPGRDASARDLLFNPIGTVLGGWLASARFLRVVPDARRSARRALASALVVAGVFAATGFLLSPGLPASQYYGQWTPQLGHLEWYRGEILEARVDTIPLPSTRLTNSEEIRAALERRSAIQFDVITAELTSRLSSMVSVYDTAQDEIFLIGPDRDDLVYRYRTVAAGLRLDQPDVRFRDVLPNVRIGDTVRITVDHGVRGTCISLDTDRECGLGFTVGSGWTVLYFSESFPLGLQQALNVAWIALVVLPVGYWARRHPLSYVAGLVILGGLLLIPHQVGLISTPFAEWIGALFGLAAGIACRHLASGASKPAPETRTVAPAHHQDP